MKDKMEAILRVIGELQQFDTNATSSNREIELDVSDLDQVFAAAQSPIYPKSPNVEDT